jgi:tripartite-type tricarboxylate transporter receptor subunit TctC
VKKAKSKSLSHLVWILALIALECLATSAQSQSEPFYKGKTLRFVVGSAAGGFYDVWGRLIARHWGKYIPGNPDIIVQNMTGAGSLTATNYVYTVAKPDGLHVILPNNSIYVEQLVGRKEVQFDLRKFHWIGSAAQESMFLYIRADTPYKSIADIVKAKEPPKCGSTGTTSSDYIVAKLLEVTVGAKINSVVGYQAGTEVDTAVEKGEVVCRARIRFPATSAENRSIPGTRKTSIAISFRPGRSGTPAQQKRRRSMR